MWASPAYAPHTGLVAFGRARSPYASQTSSYDLHIMDRDGSDRRQIFPSAEEMGFEFPELAWSPAGDQIVSVYQNDLYLIDVGSPEPEVHQLTVAGGATAVDWQPGSWDADFEREAYDSGVGGGVSDDEVIVDDVRDDDDDREVPLPTVRPEDADEKFGPEIPSPTEDDIRGTPTPSDNAPAPDADAGEEEETPEAYDWRDDDSWHRRPD